MDSGPSLLNFYLECGGVFVAAVTGALASSRVRMDVFGVIVCGIVTAIGGGSLRDMILNEPVFWTAAGQEIYISLAAVSGIFAFIWARYSFPVPMGSIRILDAVVLAMFAFIGCAKTLALGFSSPVAVVMGILTGIAGGMARDVLTGNVPYVLRPGELYATAAGCGCIVYCAMVKLWDFTPEEATLPCIAVTLLLRMAAIYWNWNLPSHRDLFHLEDYSDEVKKELNDEVDTTKPYGHE